MRSGFLHRAARRVVRGYPQPWRERYEGELLALLEDSPARQRDVIDLMRGLVVERARSTFEPGDRPVMVTTLVSLAAVVRFVAIAAPPVLAGWAARYWFGPPPRGVERFALAASGVVVLTFILLSARTRSPARMPWEPRKVLSNRLGRVYLGLAMPLAFLLSWTSTGALQNLQQLWWFFPVWDHFVARHPWQVEMARALHFLRTAQNQMKWAQMELQRCANLVAEGVPAPLQEARDAIERLTRQQDEALATLHGLGYRASLRSKLSPDP
jgi:hypothetical protein